jgi:virulence-associated protein VagC
LFSLSPETEAWDRIPGMKHSKGSIARPEPIHISLALCNLDSGPKYILDVYMITKVFRSGNSRAVRIPASIKLYGPEVEIVDLGEGGVLLKELTPGRDPWDLFQEGIAELGGEWEERVQENDQTRQVW